MFDIGYKESEIVSHGELCKRAHCGCMGGIRYSKANNVLVLFMKNNGQYDNSWDGDILHYMGSGKGNQSVEKLVHQRMIHAAEKDTAICLFEWVDNEKCKYVGRMVLTENARIEKRKNVCGDDEDKVIFLRNKAK